MNVEGFGRLLEGSLGIEEPWYVEKVWFDDEAIELHISVGVRKTALIVCPKCGSVTSRFGYEKKGARLAARGYHVLPDLCPLQTPKDQMPALRGQADQRTLGAEKQPLYAAF